MAKTITANSGAITLNTTTPTNNPLTILSGVTVSATVGIAIHGDNSQAWNITNAGTISSPTGYGVELEGGGTVTNSGRVAAGVTGVWLKGVPATAINQGTISGGDDGVILSAGGYVSNAAGAAAISGGLHGVYVFGAAATVTNQGTITGTGTNSDGVKLLAGGKVFNQTAAASISGGQWGVYLTGSAAATVSNQGTISGAAGAVHFGNANGNVFYLFPGAVTNGVVQGGTGSNLLRLFAGVASGVISGIGSHFAGFGVIQVAADSQWLMTGSNTLSPPTQLNLEPSATLKVGGTLIAPANLSLGGLGVLAASDGGHIEVGAAGTARAGQIVIDAGHQLVEFAAAPVLAAPVIINRGLISSTSNGLQLASASSVTNSGAAATITGPQSGVIAKVGGATVTNQGTISGVASAGVDFEVSGTLINSGTAARITGNTAVYLQSGVVTNAGIGAVIVGNHYGVFAIGGPVTVTNQGSISATAVKSTGVWLHAGGVVTNSGTSAAISGTLDGVYAGGGAPVVTNQGTVFGNIYGVMFSTGGTVANNGTAARIVGSTGVGSTGQATTVINQGTIAGLSYDGLNLTDGGVVTNSGSLAGITGKRFGVGSSGAHTTITNQGRIVGTSGDGVLLRAGGTVANNSAGAVIAGENWGVAAYGVAAVTNQGSIIGTAADGVYLGAGGAVNNSGTASRISGGQSGIYASGATATITNQGSVVGASAYGVFLEAGGSVTNSGTAAHIAGTLYGIGASRVAATIVNQGSIFGNYGAIYTGAGGAVRNTGTAALLSGGRWGVYGYGAVADTVTNQGTISGGNGAVHFDNANGNDFQEFPGAVAIGVVQGGTGTDTLELGAAAATGTITGIGSAFTNFEELLVDTGAHWLIAGANTLSAMASIAVTGSASLGVTGTLTAPGNLTVTGLGTLAASGGRIEVGTAAAALANQIVVDAAHTLQASGVLSSGTLRVASGGLLLGVGTVTGVAANSGQVDAAGGVLTMAATVSGSGMLKSNPGATLTLDGASNSAAVVVNLGTIILSPGDSLDVSGVVNTSSTGIFVLTNAAFLELAADTGAGNAISFLGMSGDKLVVDAVGQFGSNVGLGTYTGPKLENFATIDAIDLKNLVFGTATIDSYTAATGLLQLHSGATRATLMFDNATLGSGSFHLGSDTGTGTMLTHS